MGEIRRFLGISRASSDGSHRVVVSNTNYDGDGIRIPREAWDFSDFRRNPQLLWNHGNDPSVPNLPIGTVPEISMEGDRIEATIQFHSGELNPHAERVSRMWEAGALRAVSIGAIPVGPLNYEEAEDGRTVAVADRMRLAEVSVVPVGADPDALAAYRSLADSIGPWEPEPEPQDVGASTETQTETPVTTTARPRARRADEWLAKNRQRGNGR